MTTNVYMKIYGKLSPNYPYYTVLCEMLLYICAFSPIDTSDGIILAIAVVMHNKVVMITMPGHVAQSVGHLTRKSGVLGSIPGLATYFRFSFRFYKKGSCELLAKVCARSTG